MNKNICVIIMNKFLILIVILLLITILFEETKIRENYVNSCPPKIIYSFIPRTFKEQQDNPIPLDEIFKTMFEQPSPWVQSFDIHKSRMDIDDEFISQ
jgi:hypothetical protein